MSHGLTAAKPKIYILVDPRDELVRYVGCSYYLEARYEQHLYARGGNKEIRAWIDRLLQEELVPRMEIIERPKHNAYGREKFWIAYFIMALDMPLLNKTPISRKTLRNITDLLAKGETSTL